MIPGPERPDCTTRRGFLARWWALLPAAAAAALGWLALAWGGWQMAVHWPPGGAVAWTVEAPLALAALAGLAGVASLAAAFTLVGARPQATHVTHADAPSAAQAAFERAPSSAAEGVDAHRGHDGSTGSLQWQIDLLQQLPGVGLLLQPAAGDWIVIAVHHQVHPQQTTAQGPGSDLPAGLSQERLQPLSTWLSTHPGWPSDPIRAVLADPASPTPSPTPAQATVRRLPLGDGACLIWLPPAPESEAAPMGERESIAYSVSHDLRAPIRVIEGFTRIVREDYGAVLDRVGNDHLDRVLGAAARMNSMIDALLALSRLSSQALRREPVALSSLAQQIAQEMHQQAPQRQVEFDLQPGLSAMGDPALLRSVLENLLGNAWKYSARREVAHIGLRCEMRQPPGAPAAIPVFAVCDDGAGFDMRFADRLFSPFQRLHSASEFAGNGIGLASVRRIVARHGGQIWAASEVDRGSCFYFTLPG
jgi:nitrogen-specific signal transduction histidine kinase